MTLASRIAHNSIISAITRVLSLGIALINVGLITRYLGTNGFGDYTTVLAFYFLITAVSDFGINQILTREISRPEAKEKKIMADVLGLRLTSVSLLSIIGVLGVLFLPYSFVIKQGIWIMFLALLFSSLSQTLNSLFQKKLVMNRLAWRELIGRFIQLGISYWAIKSNLGLLGILLAMVISFLFVLLASWQLANKYTKISFSFDFAYWKYFLKESAPLGIAAFVNFLYFKADTILLSLLQNSHDVGIYGSAYKVLESLIYFPFMFMGLVMPVFSYNIFYRPKNFLRVASRTLKALWLVTLPLVILLFFLAPEAIRVIAGPGFEEATLVLRILSLALGAIFLAHFFNSILIVVNQQKLLLWILTATAGLSLVLNFILIPYYSYMAVAVVSTLCEVLVTFLVYWFSRRWGVGKGEGWEPLPIISMLVASLGMILILLSLDMLNLSLWLRVIVKGLVGSSTYLILIFSTRGLKLAEVKELLAFSKNG